MTSLKNFAFLVLTVVTLASCNHDFNWIERHEKPRVEYAPNMYYSEAYEPMKQITDSNKYGNEYNSNPYNAYQMNMRVPVKGSIKRNTVGNWPYYWDSSRVEYLPYQISADSLDYAAKVLRNPLDTSAATVKDGQALYERYCLHCHGATGQGDGEVGKRLAGVPKYNEQRLKNVSAGHIFHVITNGKGRMGSHASQLSQEERWKIVTYVQTLQKQPTE